VRAYAATLRRLPYLLAERHRIRTSRLTSSNEFVELLEKYNIAVRLVAWL
jgi:hypothetical protein